MIILVRHGSTENNDEGVARGWDKSKLDRNGVSQAHSAATILRNLIKSGLSIHSFKTSDLPRTVETSKIIGKKIGLDATPTKSLRTWNIGNLVGKDLDATRPEINRLTDSPQEKAPDGESYNDFYNRAAPEIKKAAQSDKNHLAVSSSGLIKIAHALSRSGGSDKINRKLVKGDGPVGPGGIVALHPDWSMTVIKK